MKKLKLKIVIIISLILIFTGCVSEKKEETKEKIKILTSFYPIYLFTQNAIQNVDNIEVSNLTVNSSGCLHGYHLTTVNMKDLENADVFLINGAGMETFLESIKNTYPNLKIVDTSEGIDLIENKFESGYNSHIWLSISNAEKQVIKIGQALAEIDASNEDKYIKNCEDYAKKLKELKNNAREALYGKEEINVITMHDAFPYFAEDVGINVTDVVQRDEDESPTPKQLSNIIENAKNSNVKAIFIEPQYSDKVAELISSETGIPVYTLDSIVTGEGNSNEYIDKMKSNIEVIRQLVTD